MRIILGLVVGLVALVGLAAVGVVLLVFTAGSSVEVDERALALSRERLHPVVVDLNAVNNPPYTKARKARFVGCSTDSGDVSVIDITAPGVCIRSTWLNGTYRTLSGTSMASPHVAGAAARYLANHPTASPTTVRTALRTAGSTGWNRTDDPDGIRESLLDASRLW